MKIEEGKVYIIDTSKCPDNGICGEFDDFEEFDGTEISWLNIEEEDDYTFYYGGWYFDKEVLVEVGTTFSRILKEDDKVYTGFKEGDLVKIRSVEDLKQYYYSNEKYIFTKPQKEPISNLFRCGGMTGIVEECHKNPDGVILKIQFDEGKEEDNINYFTSEAVEIVEAGYRERVKREIMERVNIPKVEDKEIIREMISKVDIEKIKKILAGAYRMKGSSFSGLDKLLEDWANAKKEIYLALGRNLTINKPIEYNMSRSDVSTCINDLKHKFPRILYSI